MLLNLWLVLYVNIKLFPQGVWGVRWHFFLASFCPASFTIPWWCHEHCHGGSRVGAQTCGYTDVRVHRCAGTQICIHTHTPSLIKIAEDISHLQWFVIRINAYISEHLQVPHTGINAVQVGESGNDLCYSAGITAVLPKDMKICKKALGTQSSDV